VDEVIREENNKTTIRPIVLLTVGNLIFASWISLFFLWFMPYPNISIFVCAIYIGVPIYVYKRVSKKYFGNAYPKHIAVTTVVCPVIVGTIAGLVFVPQLANWPIFN
jgi:hypothetical protein